MSFGLPPQGLRSQTLAIEQVPSPLILFDDEGRLTHWNAAAADLFALPTASQDSPASLLVPRHMVPHWAQAFANARTQGKWNGELRLQTAQGDERVVEVRLARGSGSLPGFVASFVDFTARYAQDRAERQAWQRRTAERMAGAAVRELLALPDASAQAKAREFEMLSLAAETILDVPKRTFDAGTVLLVGCGSLGRECLRLLLEARGLTVLTAADSSEAIERMNADRTGIRAAVIDADLPGWGAAAAITALRRQDSLLPVVLLGRKDGQRIPDEVQATVPKPYRLDDVLWGLNESQIIAVGS